MKFDPYLKLLAKGISIALSLTYEDSKIVTFEQKHIGIGIFWELIGQNEM